jgi:hypothetical protein
MNLKRPLPATWICCLLLLAACHKEENPANDESAGVGFVFRHVVGASALAPDTLAYVNCAGNRYKVTDLQYFISGITLTGNGKKIEVATDGGIHYVDLRIPATQSWAPSGVIPTGKYDSVSFIFGIDSANNYSNRFPNPPERDMAWPDILGGGYHYMKLNMMWKNDTMVNPMPFMFHLGIGQIYSGITPDPDSIVSFVQNWFRVTLPASVLVEPGSKKEIVLVMDLSQWFCSSEVFDFAQYPMMIMQNQEGMAKACRNGRQAFRISVN